MRRLTPHPLLVVVTLLACVAGCGSVAGEVTGSGSVAISSAAKISSPLKLSASAVTPGHTITGKVTYKNATSFPIVLDAIVIAARPPGGTHAGGPFDDFAPTAPARTLAPGATVTVSASRAFTSADPLGAWDLYATYEDVNGAWHDGPDVSLEVTDGAFVISSALALSAPSVAAGQTVTGTVTYSNQTSSPVVVNAAVIAARPPGGSHAGGPYDDLQPYAPATTVAPGATLVVKAARAFSASDRTGAWDVYPTYEDGSGVWHDGPDLTLNVGSAVADAGTPVDAGAIDAGHDAGTTGGGNPVQAPLSGAVGPGTWQAADISVPGVQLPSGKPFHYNYLLPAQYDPSVLYPVLVHEHEDQEGDPWYDGQNGDPLYLASASGADSWYNNTAWRTAYPCIVILPYADQTANGTDGNDAIENFGGWTNTGITGTETTFSGDSGPNVFAVAGLVRELLASYPVNPAKVYITGDSLGGIGSWYMMLMYNRVNGPSGRLFTAGLPFAGVMELNGFGAGPSAAQIAELRDVPVFAVSGAQDGTSNPPDWNQPLWRALAGNSSYPGPPSGALAGGSSFHYLEDPNLGHDVWDTYRPLPAGGPMYDWLFSQ